MFGLELDVAIAPDFFAKSPAVSGSNVTTVMGNLIVSAPIGAIRPYVSGGAGLIKQSIDSPNDLLRITNHDFGADVGAGLMVFFNQKVGLRTDVRLFRDLRERGRTGEIDLASFHFWRGTIGVAFRF